MGEANASDGDGLGGGPSLALRGALMWNFWARGKFVHSVRTGLGIGRGPLGRSGTVRPARLVGNYQQARTAEKLPVSGNSLTNKPCDNAYLIVLPLSCRPDTLRYQLRNQFFLRSRPLRRIACPAQQLQVVRVIRPALRLRQHVVNREVAEREVRPASRAVPFLLAVQRVLVGAVIR